jgi:hypothetical protein
MENGEKPTMARASTYQPLLLLPRKHPRTFRGVNQERLNEFMKLYLSKGEFHVFTVVVSRFRYSHVALCFDQGFCNHVFTWSAREWIDNGRTIDHERSALGTSLGVFLCSTFIPDAKGEDTSGSS